MYIRFVQAPLDTASRSAAKSSRYIVTRVPAPIRMLQSTHLDLAMAYEVKECGSERSISHRSGKVKLRRGILFMNPLASTSVRVDGVKSA